MTVATIASSNSRWTRHSECTPARAARRRGGSVQEKPGLIFDEQRGKEVSEDPTSCGLRMLVWQLIDTQQALEALEEELDLPAQSIERENLFGRGVVGRERGEKEDILGRLGGFALGVLP